MQLKNKSDIFLEIVMKKSYVYFFYEYKNGNFETRPEIFKSRKEAKIFDKLLTQRIGKHPGLHFQYKEIWERNHGCIKNRCTK